MESIQIKYHADKKYYIMTKPSYISKNNVGAIGIIALIID